jgi:hypothetical protein
MMQDKQQEYRSEGRETTSKHYALHCIKKIAARWHSLPTVEVRYERERSKAGIFTPAGRYVSSRHDEVGQAHLPK